MTRVHLYELRSTERGGRIAKVRMPARAVVLCAVTTVQQSPIAGATLVYAIAALVADYPGEVKNVRPDEVERVFEVYPPDVDVPNPEGASFVGQLQVPPGAGPLALFVFERMSSILAS